MSFYATDFETTVYDGQEKTEVWSACIVELNRNNKPRIYNSIESWYIYIQTLHKPVIYFHNLKFDGAFIVDFLMREGYIFKKITKPNELSSGEFCALISSMGAWYKITICIGGKIIEIRDSLKLLPYSLERIGESFQTKHKKLKMEYKGYRYAGCTITDEEKNYIENDVYVLKEALEIMFENGHTQLTIGSCCLKEFRSLYDKEDYNNFFPNLYECPLDNAIYGSDTIGDYIHNAYRGGWCYVDPRRQGQIVRDGNVYDVNSLYPSMMSSESGNYYPVGMPSFWNGEIPYKKLGNKEWFVRFSCRFYLKPDMLPCVQIKRNKLYRATEYLRTSDIKYNGTYSRYYTDLNNTLQEARVTMTMTRPDYELFIKHYEVKDIQILDGCYFFREIGLFDEYIEFYKRQKMESTGAKREEAKLYLNNLYGKMASSPDSSYKEPYIDEETDAVNYHLHTEREKIPGYIPIGSYITAYSRCFTISAAQNNYPIFLYADTDSIHCCGEAKDIPIHDKAFCHWKHESHWSHAKFVRQKTYIESIIHSDGNESYDIKCAGMPQKCKDYFLEHYTIDDFKLGLCVPGKLLPKRIPGGIVLKETTYKMT